MLRVNLDGYLIHILNECMEDESFADINYIDTGILFETLLYDYNEYKEY